MYLFILESIGTSELLLIALAALIIFGPRKLPEMMRMFGKAMAEFRRSTNEFKESWEKEVDFEGIRKEGSEIKNLLESPLENSIGKPDLKNETEIVSPEIKEIDQEVFQKAFPDGGSVAASELEMEQNLPVKEPENYETGKRDWL